jgi:protease-4
MDMLGIESKVYTAGPRKVGKNPLTRTTEEEEMDLRNLLSETHEEFINYVKERRLEKIKEEANDDLFSGAVFESARALELGLVDGIYTWMEDKDLNKNVVKVKLMKNITVQKLGPTTNPH